MTDIQGKELSRRLHEEVVSPLLAQHFPQLAYSAGLFGYGSEVLGFDTDMSRDHDWGPRVQLFLKCDEALQYKSILYEFFSLHLPHQFYGYSTHFGEPNLADNGTRHMADIKNGPVSHRLETYLLDDYLNNYLPVNLMRSSGFVDWLITPQQKLRTIVDGSIFYDGLGILHPLQETVAWYPEDLWFFIMASAWSRIGQEEHLMGRCGYVGDEIGSVFLADSILRTLMQICFLLEKKYAPYPKWFGTAFQHLSCAEVLTPLIEEVQRAENWQKRQLALCEVYQQTARNLNALHLIPPISEDCSSFFGRPFLVLWGGKIAEQLQKLIRDPQLAAAPLIGNIDIISTSTDVLENNEVCRSFRAAYPSLA